LLALVTTAYLYGYNPDFRRAVACPEQKNYQCATKNHSEAIRGSPGYAAAYSGLRWAYLSQGNYQKAIEDCDSSQLQGDLAEAPTCRGLSYSARQDFERVLADCNKAITLMPEALVCRAGAYVAQKKYTDAFKDRERAILLKPELTWAYVTRGLAYAETGRSANASLDS
jgi:tetratricopeptide (TPR) repeat protein